MGFKKFKKGSFRGTGEPQITIRESESVGINKIVMEEYFDDHDGVVIYYNEEDNQIGLQPADADDNPDAYRLNTTTGSGSLQVASFLKRYDLVPEETTAYEPEWNDDEGLVVIDLDEPL